MTSNHFRIVEHIAEGCYTREHERSLVNSNTQVPRLAVKQYIPLNNLTPQDGDVTIIGGHANGIPKEVYEPLYVELLQRSSQNGFNIRSIWIADTYNQGQSAILNEDIMGNDPWWIDHARDLLVFINSHRSDMPQPLAALGHSLSASQLVHLSIIHPSLFKTLVLIEPGWSQNSGTKASIMTLRRRDRWPSREQALQEFRESRFYGLWDLRGLGLFAQYGLRDASGRSDDMNFDERDSQTHREGVVLTTPRHQELATIVRATDGAPDDGKLEERFGRPEAMQLLSRVSELKPSVFYLWGGKSGPWSGARKEIFDRTGTGVFGSGGKDNHMVYQGVVEGGTHFVPLEKPAECAEQVAGFLGRELARLKQVEEKARSTWGATPRHEQLQADRRILKEFGSKDRTGKL